MLILATIICGRSVKIPDREKGGGASGRKSQMGESGKSSGCVKHSRILPDVMGGFKCWKYRRGVEKVDELCFSNDTKYKKRRKSKCNN